MTSAKAETPRTAAGRRRRAEIERPAELNGSTWRIPFDGSNLWVTVNHDGKRVLEVFVRGPLSMSVGLLASQMLRGGFDVAEVAESLNKVLGTHALWFNQRLCTSPEQAVAECLLITKRRLEGAADSARKSLSVEPAVLGTCAEPQCPECAVVLQTLAGCEVCPQCGYSTAADE